MNTQFNNDEIRLDFQTFVLRRIVVQAQSGPVLKPDFHSLCLDPGVSINRRIQDFLDGAISPVFSSSEVATSSSP